MRLEFKRPPRRHLKKRFQKKVSKRSEPAHVVRSGYFFVPVPAPQAYHNSKKLDRVVVNHATDTTSTERPRQTASWPEKSVWRRSTTVRWARHDHGTPLRRLTSLHDQRLTSRAASMRLCLAEAGAIIMKWERTSQAKWRHCNSFQSFWIIGSTNWHVILRACWTFHALTE